MVEKLPMSEPNHKPIGGNTGHGHVWARPDGMKARCGGPGICRECSRDLARFERRLDAPSPANPHASEDIVGRVARLADALQGTSFAYAVPKLREAATEITTLREQLEKAERERDEWKDIALLAGDDFNNEMSLREAAQSTIAQLRTELDEALIEIEAAKAFGGGFFGGSVREVTREHYRSAIRARSLTSQPGDA